jgi:dipeptidyl-peptidase-3
LYFESYLKRFWVSNGIHHHYAEVKLMPEFSSNFLIHLFDKSPKASLPLIIHQDTLSFKKWFVNLLFNPKIEYKRVNKAENIDQVKESANNFYEGVTQAEVDDYYNSKKKKEDTEPISWGLNSKLVKENGNITEKIWKEGGMYSNCISKMIFWLNKAIAVSETPEQKKIS